MDVFRYSVGSRFRKFAAMVGEGEYGFLGSGFGNGLDSPLDPSIRPGRAVSGGL
jgi:hypothetical protein